MALSYILSQIPHSPKADTYSSISISSFPGRHQLPQANLPPSQNKRSNQVTNTDAIYRMKKDSLRFQKLRFLFTWSRPRKSSLWPTTSDRISSRRNPIVNIKSKVCWVSQQLTIFEIPWIGGVQGPGHNRKFDLLELLALDTGPLGESFLGLSENLTLLIDYISKRLTQ